MAASGGRTAPRRSPPRRSPPRSTSKPASLRITLSARRIWRSSSHDEHAPPGAHSVAALATGCGAVGGLVPASRTWNTKVVPCPGNDSARSRPPFASTKPRAIASPSPDPVESELCRATGGRARRPARAPPRGFPARGPRSAAPRSCPSRARARRPAPSPRSDSSSRARSRTPARAGRRRRAPAAGRDRARRRSRPPGAGTDSSAARHDLVERTPVGVRVGAARLEAREVEQVLDEPRQARALGLDHRDELAPLDFAQGRRVEPARRGRDRGERRAQVVRDRPQHRRLDHVAAAQGLRLDHLASSSLRRFGRPDERLERGHHAVLERVDTRLVGVPRHEHGARCARRRR